MNKPFSLALSLSPALLLLGLLTGCTTGRKVQVNRPLNANDLHPEEPLYLVLLVGNAAESAKSAELKARGEEVAPPDHEVFNDLFKELLAFRMREAGPYNQVEIADFGPDEHRRVWQQATFLEIRVLWNISGKPGALKVQYTSMGQMVRRPIDKVVWQGNIITTVRQKDASQSLEELINQGIGKQVDAIVEGVFKDP